MKSLHQPDFFGWSRFDEARNLDFNSVLWTRSDGNVLIDPLPLTAHDEKHLAELGGARLVIITNSDHVRDSVRVAKLTGAQLAGPRAEQESFPVRCDVWLGEGDRPITGLQVVELTGSKTPGELSLVIEETTLVTGDLVRAHRAGRLNLLPAAKLADRPAAIQSVRRLFGFERIDAVLVGDGWPVFRDGRRALEELLESEGAA